MLATTVATQGLVPWLILRLGSGPALALGLVLLGAPAPLYGLSPHLAVLLPVSAVRGTGFALLTVIGATLTGRVAPRERHGESVGLYGPAIALPNLGAVPRGVALTQAGHFPLVAILAACPVLACRWPSAPGWAVGSGLRCGREGPEPPEAARVRPRARTLSSRRVALLTMAPSVVLLLVTAARRRAVDVPADPAAERGVATVALLVFGAAAAHGAVAGGRAGRPGRLAGAAAGVLVAAAAGLVGVGAVPARRGVVRLVLLVAVLVFGLGYGAVQNVTLVIAFARAGAAGAPTASAVWNAAFDTGTALGAFGVGALADAGLGPAVVVRRQRRRRRGRPARRRPATRLREQCGPCGPVRWVSRGTQLTRC